MTSFQPPTQFNLNKNISVPLSPKLPISLFLLIIFKIRLKLGHWTKNLKNWLSLSWLVGIVWNKINSFFWLIMLIFRPFIFLGQNFTHGALKSSILEIKEKTYKTKNEEPVLISRSMIKKKFRITTTNIFEWNYLI